MDSEPSICAQPPSDSFCERMIVGAGRSIALPRPAFILALLKEDPKNELYPLVIQYTIASKWGAVRTGEAENDYLLATKLLCGYCGADLCGEAAPATREIYTTTTLLNCTKKKR